MYVRQRVAATQDKTPRQGKGGGLRAIFPRLAVYGGGDQGCVVTARGLSEETGLLWMPEYLITTPGERVFFPSCLETQMQVS